MSIDRRALVARHDVVVRGFDPEAALTVGNGDFACTVDATGLQSFPALYARGGGLHVQSTWGWHSCPNPAGYSDPTYPTTDFDQHGRRVAYAQRRDEFAHRGHDWLRGNPHRLDLGRIGLALFAADGALLGPESIDGIDCRLDLWRGVVVSRFRCAGVAVAVEIACHPGRDALGVRIRSPLIAAGRLGVTLAFPYGTQDWATDDWTRPEAHDTAPTIAARGVAIARRLDAERYHVAATATQDLDIVHAARHVVLIRARGGEALDLSIAFAPEPIADESDDIHAASARHWAGFWSSGGAVDLAGSSDPRAPELERRVVLSQYLTAVNCASRLPPQETGLTCNSWMGKFHLEMHWWHGVHFPLWGRPQLLERSLDWYRRILPQARAIAAAQGHRGARWPKCVAEGGVNAPCTIEPWLIWQQPHPIQFAELMRRADASPATLARYAEIVDATAEFMADFAEDDAHGFFHLGPPIIPAQEAFAPAVTWDPPYELAYWAHALAIANRWRELMGRAREPRWDEVRVRLAPPPVDEGVYVAHAGCDAAETYERKNWDHPSMLGALGMVPRTHLIDDETMRRTLKRALAEWRWDDTWGWDFPMAAMTAARLDEPALAIDALLMPAAKNRYLANGHNWQTDFLPLYLPGNGGVLAAVALMCAGWEGAPARPAPGFPSDGSWTVVWEGLNAWL